MTILDLPHCAEPVTEPLGGMLSVLNCGLGDLEIAFDKDDARQVAKAKRVINDMLKRGYLLFVKHGEEWVQVKSFDPEQEAYMIEEGPLYSDEQPEPEKPKKKRGRPRKTAKPLRTTRAIAVGPTAGG